jgi:predicted permease
MPSPSGFRRIFRLGLHRPRSVAGEVDDEIRFHLEMRTAQLIQQGLSPEAAREEATRRFGNMRLARHDLHRSARRRETRMLRRERLEAIWQDVSYALRQLRRAPGFAVAVVLTLALAIGANATMFGIIDRLLLRPPALLHDPGTTHRVYLERVSPLGETNVVNNVSFRRYRDLREATSSFAELAAFFNTDRVIGTGENARQLRTGLVSASYWRFFGVRPAVGRFFGPDEEQLPNGSDVVVLGYGYWQSAFAGDRGVLGRQLRIGGKQYTIIGVAPPGFSGMSATSVVAFIPIPSAGHDMFGARWGELVNTHNLTWIEIIARRKPEVTVEAATADITNAFRRSVAAEPQARPLEQSRPRALLASIIYDRGPNRGQNARVAIWLVGVSAIVLLIACANVANLLLARARRRSREIAVRVALGVSRGRLMAQLLTESLVLAALGGAAGLLIAHWGGGILRATLLPDVEWSSVGLDHRMLLFTLGAATVAGVLAGLAPAVQGSGSDVNTALKAGGREGSIHRSRTRTALLLVQVAMSVVLLVGAGLFARSLQNVLSLELGYDPERLLFVDVDMPGGRLEPTIQRLQSQRILDEVRALPDVEQATVTASVPFYMTWNADLFVPGIDSVELLGDFTTNAVSPEYFETMGTRIVRGRGPTSADREGSPLVAVVSESMARVLWPGQDPLGKCIKVNADTMPCSEVIGVAQDVRRNFDESPMLQYYLPEAQSRARGSYFVRTRGEARRSAELVRRTVQRELTGNAFANVQPLQDILDPNLRPWKMGATMFSVFGALALLVAAVGLYGVIAFNVTQRMHEMGVRIALGAQTRDIVRLVTGEGVRVALVGVLIGTAIALFATKYLASLLFRVSARDPMVLVAVGVTLLAVAFVASVVPAMRGARADPNSALRAD